MKTLKHQQGFIWTLAMPWLATLLTSAITWIFRKAVITFFVITAIYVLIEFLSPLVIRLASNYFNFQLPDFAAGFTDAAWYFMSIFKIDLGLKLAVAAYATRFLIRRIPVVG
jgi:hypothetical protein